MATPTPLQPRNGLLDMMGQGDSGFAGWLDPRRNAIINFGAGMIGHGTAKERMAGAAQGLQTGRQQDTAQALLMEERAQQQLALQQQTEERNQTLEWLKTNFPQYANLPPAQGFQLATAEMGRAGSGGANAETFFGTPVPFQTEEGVQYGQLGNQGTFRPIPLPEGGQFAPRVTQVDVGNEISVQDQHGNELYRMPKTGSLPAAYEPAPGGGIQPMPGSPDAAAADQSRMQMVDMATQTLETIDGLINDPNLGMAVGVGGILPAIPGTPQAATVARINQIQGQVFLQAFESLKGGGVITEIEGQKAEQAKARLDRAQTQEDFTAALKELREIVATGLARAQGQTPAGSGVVDYTTYFQ